MNKNNTDRIQVKLVIFTVHDGRLKVFLGSKKLPQATLGKNASLDKVAEKVGVSTFSTSVKQCYIEQLYTVAEKSQVSVVYFLLYPSFNKVVSPDWIDVAKAKISPDYAIISYAIQRIRWKIEYTNVVYSLLPDEFTFSQLQQVYEAVLGKVLDKRNFRKKISSLNILKSTGKKTKMVKARPAQMYRFQSKHLTYVKIL